MTTTAIPTGKFVWFEYVSNDANKAQGFYGELFGWTTQKVPMPDGDYTMIAANGKTIGGYSPIPDGAPKQASWLSHLQVANAKESAQKVKSLGGAILMDAFKVGDFGTMAVVADPQGSALALWQPTKAEASGEPANGQFCWNELYAKDPTAAVKFYGAIGGFGLETKAMAGMGDYHVLTSDGAPRAGVCAPPMPQAPLAWLPYVQVANADATVEKAKRLGGEIVVPPASIPGVGRFAILKDTQGVGLGLLQPE